MTFDQSEIELNALLRSLHNAGSFIHVRIGATVPGLIAAALLRGAKKRRQTDCQVVGHWFSYTLAEGEVEIVLESNHDVSIELVKRAKYTGQPIELLLKETS